MNPTDYSQLPLRDIHLPAAVGWWPPAVGWWLLFGLVLVCAVWLGWRYHLQFRQRAALRGLRAVARTLAAGGAPVDCMQRISIILRRFAMSVASDARVAGLTGEAWLGFLDSRWSREEFTNGSGRVLVFGPYARPDRVSATDVSALNQLCMDWVQAQRSGRR